MTYDTEQAQRRDIETALGRISLEVDSENTSDNPYLHIPSTFVGNNWFQQGEKIVKLNITEDDSLSFVVSALTNLRQKNVTNVIVSFDYEVDNVNVNYPLLVNVSFASSDLTSYKSCETILTTQGHIEVDCSLFDFSSDIVNNAITEQGFTIGLNFNGNLSNATVKISNVVFGFKYTNLLQAEIDAVKNRLGDLNPNIEIVTSWNETLSNDKVPSEKLTKESIDVKADSVHSHIVTDVDGLQSSLDSKQAKLISGTNIKTINNNSLLGSGNITIQGGSSVDIVTSWSSTLSDSKVPSEKLTKNSLDGKANSSHTHTKSQITDFPTIPSKISDLTNDSDFIETSSTSGLIKNDGTIDTTQYLSSLPSHNHNDLYNTKLEEEALLGNKQDLLTSGVNIKTINNNSILGSGNLDIQGSSVDIVTDWELDPSDSKVPSEKLVKDSLDGKADTGHNHDSRYHRKQEILGMLLNKSDITHTHRVFTIDNTSIDGANALSESVDYNGEGIGFADDKLIYNQQDSKIYYDKNGSADTDPDNELATLGDVSGGGSVDIATSWGNPTSNSKVPSEKLVKDSLDLKLDTANVPTKISDLTNDSDFIETNLTSGLIKNDGTVDTTQYQVNLVSGTNIKTINHQDILGSGNISVVSNVTYYSLSSSDYNPSIDSTVTITCTVTNASGVPVIGKNVELFNNGVSAGTVSTDLNGTATWNVTLSDWDNHHFTVENATLDLKAIGWKNLVNDTNYLCQTNGKDVFFYVRISTSYSHPTSFTAFGGGAKVPVGYRPRASVTENAYNNYNILVAVKSDGTVERRSMTGSSITSTLYATFYWTI